MKTDLQIIDEILNKKFKEGADFGKHHNWCRGFLDGHPVLVDYEKQVVWYACRPLHDEVNQNISFDMGSDNDRD